MNYLKNETFSIRKSSLGVASVVIGLVVSGQAVYADDFKVDVATQVVAYETSEPGNSTDTMSIPESNQLIHVQPLWEENIKGQGQVVAVVDSGLDPETDAMQGITDASAARVQSASEMENIKKQSGISYGKWVNDKVVYTHNYNDWNDQVKEAETRSHGMIVASSAVANPSQVSPNGELAPGVAPESQLMFMRVFSDQHSGTQPYIYLKAVEDAIKLGADVINLSLGGESALTNEVGKMTSDVAALAREKGILITAAAGNSKVFGFGHANPSTDNPDYGLVSRPSVARNILSVGATNNSVNNVEVVTIPQLAIGQELSAEERKIYAFEANKLPNNQEFSYIPIINGAEADFAGKELTDKIALVLRSQETATNIVSNALKAGAKGVLIANDKAGAEVVKGEFIDDLEQEIPVAFIGYKAGQLLAKHEADYKLLFDGSRLKIPYDKSDELLDFTSWGFSGDGFIKPDIVAPGGKVFAAINDGRYDTDQGTSFSAPQVAGAVALIKQVFKERFPQLQGSALHDTIKALLMSQATPHIDPQTGAYTSPRRQGAGLLDTYRAAYGDVIITGKDGYPSLSLGNIDNQFNLDLQVQNLGLFDKEVEISYVVNTDQVENGHVTLRPRLLKEVTLAQKKILPAGTSITIPISIDTKEFAKELDETFANGYFLEGFVFLKDAHTGEKLASIPYAGFKGEFQNLAAFEQPIYDFKDEKRPFYYFVKDRQEKDPENNFTALTGIKEIDKEPVEIVIGEKFDEKTETYSYDANHLAFSPNDDRQLDDISLKVTALRNYENVHLTIYAKDDIERKHPLFQQGNERGEKSYFDDGIDKKSETIEDTLWDGRDQDGNLLPDGDYQYVVRYRPAASGGAVQELSFLITLDTVAPQIDGKAGDFDQQTRIFKPASIIETGSGMESILLLTNENQSLTSKEDGTFEIPEELELADLDLLVTDYAGNRTRLNLAGQSIHAEESEETTKESKKDGAKKDDTSTPSLEVQFIVDGKLKPRYNSTGRYIVTNSQGERVDGEFVINKSTLPEIALGSYKVELVLLGENLELLSPKTVEVTLSEQSPKQVVTFEVVKHVLNKFDILFDQDVPEGTKITVIDSKGNPIELLPGFLDRRTFENRLVNGTYRVLVDMPAGYEVSQNNFEYEVGDHINRQFLSFVYKKPTTSPETIVLVPVEENTREKEQDDIEHPVPSPNNWAVKQEKNVSAGLSENHNHKLLPKTSSTSSMLVYAGVLLQTLLVPLYFFNKKNK